MQNPTVIQLERVRDLIFTLGICPTVKINVRGFCLIKYATSNFKLGTRSEYTLENTEGAIKMDIPAKLGTYGTQDEDKKTKTQHNICWTPLYAIKHKYI